MATLVRDAMPQDEAAWRKLWAAYLQFYGVDLVPAVADATWTRIMDPASVMFMRVADAGGTVVGFAICITHEATWVIDPVCYLEDLFVDESMRGTGTGRALLDDLVAMSQQNGWSRLYWHTDENNQTARKLYDRYVASDGHIRYRMSF